MTATLATINSDPAAATSALETLVGDIGHVIESFIGTHPNMPAVAVLGVLRVIEANFIERLP